MCVSACDCTTDNCFWPFVQPRIISERDRLLLFYWQRLISLCSPLTVRMRRPDAFVYTLTIANRGRTAAESDQVRKIAHRLMTISGGFGICMPGGRTDGGRKSTCVVLNLLLRRPKVAPATEEMKRATLCLLQRWTNGNNFPQLRPSIPVAFDSTAAATPRPVLRRRRCCCSFPPLGYSIIEPILRRT